MAQLFESVPDEAIVRTTDVAGLPDDLDLIGSDGAEADRTSANATSVCGFSLIRRHHQHDDAPDHHCCGPQHPDHHDPRSTLPDELRERGLEAYHNHYVALLTHSSILPLNAPRPAPAPAGVAAASDGGVSVLVVDTVADVDLSGSVPPAAIHGPFVKGVIESNAPNADVTLCQPRLAESPEDGRGAIAEWDLGATLNDALSASAYHVVNMSLGGYAEPDRGMHFLDCVLQRHSPNTVFVAAAGNDGLVHPVYPAASRHVISVGAALEDGSRPADFSNYGPTVTRWAPGINVRGPVAEGFAFDVVLDEENAAKAAASHDLTEYARSDDDATTGWAYWDGTSVAAPQVTAQLAERIAAHPDTTVVESERRM